MAPKPIKVSQLNAYIKRVLQSDPILSNVSVTGEISNFKYHGTGNIYFTLKDEASKLNCFLGSEFIKAIGCELSDGMEIIASGSIYLYERGGYYSLNVRSVSVAGEGSLSIAFNKMKEKLEKEGLFDQSRKKALPAFPRKLAVITSETGAAVRDIITTVRNRNNHVDIMVFPCLVQGYGAAPDIAGMIDRVNAEYSDIDLMIVGRGGGSMEELWAFNEEIVARSIFASRIPVISAVGHETDFTIADFTADLRAATPTAAAQMAVPDTTQLCLYLDEIISDCRRAYGHMIVRCEMKVDSNNFASMQQLLLHKIEIDGMKAKQMAENSSQLVRHIISKFEARMDSCKTALESLNPSSVIKKGYCAVTDSNGKYITSAKAVEPGGCVFVIMKDGTLDCDINRIVMEE